MGIDRDVARGLYHTLADTFRAEGRFYFEMWIRTPASGKTWCDMAIHLANPEHHKSPDILVGIEVKDWKDPVPPSVIKNEFKGYESQFDYFYFAANEFAPSVDDIDNPHLGLIDMGTDFKVVQQPRPQGTISWNRFKFIEALNRNWDRNHDSLEDQYPELVRRVDGVEIPREEASHPEQSSLAYVADNGGGDA